MEQDYEKLIKERVENLFHTMEQRVTPKEMEQIKAAYQLAHEAHKEQTRKTGEPYIIHPIAVARIVAEELMLGANPVIAAFLHDVVEDTPHTVEDIEKQFGEDVAFLVRVVTKQKKEHYEMSKQLDNFKQMLDSVHYDIRAILIKLADRLHNMRTLDSMKPDKQMKIAGETDYFYAPLANRLGLYEIKTELENLSFRFRCPHEYAQFIELLQQDKSDNHTDLKSFTDKIGSILQKHNIQAKIEVQYRMPYSLWRKINQSHKDFKHLDHRHFIQIIFPDDLEASEKNICLKIYSLLTDIFKEKPGSIANYVDSPKENGYQSFHVKLLSEHGVWEEIHISSERMIYNSQFGCVASRSESNVKKWIEKFKFVLQDIAYHSQDGWFIENVVSSFYNDDIMVFTPKGQAVILPQHATALDFAFEIHSRLGEHAQYARINGKLCSIKTVLHRGDCVEVGANEQIHPQPDWINHVLTYKAKRYLRTYLYRMKKIPYQRCPYCQPLPGDEVIGFTENDKSVTIHKRDCPTAIRLASQKGDSIVSIEFKEDNDILYPVRIHIRAIDRYHLLSDLIDCITNKLKLSIESLHTTTTDEIVDCFINFSVHSFNELQIIISHINRIKGVDEVQREELK